MLVNLRFCLIGNYLSKIIPALQSRCTRYTKGIHMHFNESSKVPLWTIGKGTDCSKAGACLQGREGEGLGISAIFTHYFRSTSMRRERSPWCAWHRETWGRFWTFYRWELKVRTVVLYFNFFLSPATWPLGKSLRIMSTLVLVSDYRVFIVEQLCSVFSFC